MNDVMANFLTGKGTQAIQAQDIGELRQFAMDGDKPRIVKAADLLAWGHLAVRQLMVEQGIYVWPTTELKDWLQARILDQHKSTIEIGAGNGVLAKALGVKAVDNMHQSAKFKPPARHKELWEQSRTSYKLTGQKEVSYGDNLIQCDALDGVKRFKPEAVIGLFITHKWQPGMEQGNAFGVDETRLLRRVKTYAMVGNLSTHRTKPLLDLPHTQHQFDGLVTRSANPELDRIFIWKRTT